MCFQSGWLSDGLCFLRVYNCWQGKRPYTIRNVGSGHFHAEGRRTSISNIVLMGIGEPMDNLDNVLRFLELVNHPDGLNIGMRHISLSTCGVIPGIERLAELNLR